MKRILICLLAAAIVIGCFAGCAKKEEPVVEQSPIVDETPEVTPEPTPEPTPEAEPEETSEPSDEPQDTVLRNPLTGEPVEEDISVNRPFIVMINNISVAQPQVGISQADMIYELMEEGGITRMMGFFTDLASVEKVGSIRSAREYNVSIVHAYDAIFVHAGGSNEALNTIDVTGVNDLCSVRGRYTGGAFYRDTSRQAYGIEHSLFGEGDLLVKSASDLGYSSVHSDGYDGTYGLHFSDTAEDQCTADASSVKLTYAGGKTTDFTYHPDGGYYTMSQYGNTYADNGETPVEFKNVLIINADTKLQSDGLHLTIKLTGSGDGYFCCGGRYVPIQWSRDGEYDAFRYTLADGTPLSLGVGKTFVAVQQVGSYNGQTQFSA